MCESIIQDQLPDIDSYARQHDLTRTAIDEILESPIDRSKEFIGKLPQYAANADRNKIIRILCRDCRKTVLALLNKPYPGENELRKAEMGDYTATCLKCGYQASDNYNWYR
jgi:RNase P subunit RPR2